MMPNQEVINSLVEAKLSSINEEQLACLAKGEGFKADAGCELPTDFPGTLTLMVHSYKTLYGIGYCVRLSYVVDSQRWNRVYCIGPQAGLNTNWTQSPIMNIPSMARGNL